ncbi:MAG: 4-phosphoerythronate dehydrogenase [Spongiibacteraceae bacterium]|nr:4-phosphoerythronate dehydrogenase [Spongiibacteraceae bacterium]
MANLLNIVADENIPKAQEYFSSLGHVSRVDGRLLSREQLMDTDILLVRSVTQVNRQLLHGTRVRFVATATIGIDHLDTQYLDEMGIKWVSAPGSNANSVVDYVVSALCRLGDTFSNLLNGSTLGIIGMGNVGASLYQRFERLGVSCKAYDPLIAQDRFPLLTSLSEVLDCEVVCCHAPLSTQGDYPSLHMIDGESLNQLRDGAVLINAGRGGVIDNAALKTVLAKRGDLQVVLDVWENEPTIDQQLLAQVQYGSAHIAGYSLDGKLAGTQMIYRACCEFLECSDSEIDEGGAVATIELRPGQSFMAGIREAVFHCYDIAGDDSRLRTACANAVDTQALAQAFDQLRKHYPLRREFSHYRIGNTQVLEGNLLRSLSALGFNLGGR